MFYVTCDRSFSWIFKKSRRTAEEEREVNGGKDRTEDTLEGTKRKRWNEKKGGKQEKGKPSLRQRLTL